MACSGDGRLEIGVKAVVQACPVFIGDLRRAIVRLRDL